MVRKFTITSVTEANSSDHLYYICTSCWKTSPQFETNVRRTCIHSLFLVIPARIFLQNDTVDASIMSMMTIYTYVMYVAMLTIKWIEIL